MIYLKYPPGAGGNWLGTVIRSLEDNTNCTHFNSHSNFHQAKQSPNITLSHWQGNVNFSGRCTWNLLCNSFFKIDQYRDLDEKDLYLNAFGKINWNWRHKTADLNYDLVFENPELFCDQLFALLDSYNIKYHSHRNIVLDSIEIYQRSCPDPRTYLDSKLWNPWCLAVVSYHHPELVIPREVTTIAPYQHLIDQHQALIKDYTDNAMIVW